MSLVHQMRISEALRLASEMLRQTLEIARQRADELTSINSSLESIFSGLHRGVAILGSDDKVLVWNKDVEDMWGLRPDEVLGTSSSS